MLVQLKKAVLSIITLAGISAQISPFQEGLNRPLLSEHAAGST